MTKKNKPKNNISHKEQENKQPTITNRQTIQQYSGPIPPPAHLEEYNNIHPGLADRLMTLAEKDAEHVREVQKKQIDQNDYKLKKEALITMISSCFAFSLLALFLICGTLLVFLNKALGGYLLAGISYVCAVCLGFLKYTPLERKKR